MFPLFITDVSLSSRTPFGVQTKLMLEHFPEGRHLFWDHHELRITGPHSARVESALFSWFTLLKLNLASKRMWSHTTPPAGPAGPPAPTLSLPKMKISWWQGNVLKPRFEARIRNRYGSKVSAVYTAPISVYACERMKSLLGAIGRPFVVHLWDITDREQHNSAAFLWLLQNAAHVFCLAEPMMDYIRPFRSDATILRFTRKPSAYRAMPTENGVLRIALLGNQKNYWDGLSVLSNAILRLGRLNIPVEVVHVGAKKKIRGGLPYLSTDVHMTGFLRSDKARDRALAKCHVGFLPGPLPPPGESNYSRFSIPSRILDFLAVGLPVLATVHSDSATAIYMRKIGIEQGIVGGSAEQLAEKLIALRNSHCWCADSGVSHNGFINSQKDQGELKEWLERAASTDADRRIPML